MRIRLAWACVAALALAGCGDGDVEAEAEAPDAGGMFSVGPLDVEPGEWRHTSRVTHAEIPGAPPAMMAQISGQISTTSSCITQAQVEQGAEAVFNQSNGQCDYSEATVEDGRLAFAGSCAAPGGQGEMTLTGSGTYTRTTYEASSVISMATPGGEVRIESETTGQRTGDC